jgi:transcriptional regulator of arginine metabolism
VTASPEVLLLACYSAFLLVVAVALDRLAWPDVVGTLAGDDTIFLAVKDGSAQRRVLGEVRKLTGG